MSPPGRPKGEYRSAQHEGAKVSPPGRPKGEYRRAQHDGIPVKRVLILQHLHADGPAYLGRWLRRHGITADLRNTEAGDRYPPDIAPYAALAVLGGEMSANDALPSLRDAERLIRQAMALGRPVIGHCLGGQLMARALGMRVAASPAPEVGWHRIEPRPCPEARAWFGDEALPEVFQWHGESFEIPPQAVHLAGNEACPNQAFAIGAHLAMQFHVEVDAEKLQRWSASADPDYLAAQQRHPTVQGAGAMLHDSAVRLQAQQRLADKLYRRWWGAAG